MARKAKGRGLMAPGQLRCSVPASGKARRFKARPSGRVSCREPQTGSERDSHTRRWPGAPKVLMASDFHAHLRCPASRLSAKLGRGARKTTCKEKRFPAAKKGLTPPKGRCQTRCRNPGGRYRPFTRSPEAPNFDEAKKRQKTQAAAYFLSVETRDSYTRPPCS